MNSKSIIIVTGNKRKIADAISSCQLFNIEVEPVKLDIDEIQSHDPIKIAEHKANTAFALLNKPLTINDAYWTIPALNGFPGGYMKDVADWFNPEDFLNLMKDKKDRSVIINENVIYVDKSGLKKFEKHFLCEFSDRPRGNGVSIEEVVIYNGQTLAEYHNKVVLAVKPEDEAWYDFAKWYSKLA